MNTITAVKLRGRIDDIGYRTYPIRSVVEGTNERSVDGLVGRLARLDARLVRLLDFPPDHAADLPGIRCTVGRGDGRVHDYDLAATAWSHGSRLAGRPRRAENPADAVDALVFDLHFHRRLLA